MLLPLTPAEVAMSVDLHIDRPTVGTLLHLDGDPDDARLDVQVFDDVVEDHRQLLGRLRRRRQFHVQILFVAAAPGPEAWNREPRSAGPECGNARRGRHIDSSRVATLSTR
jgi:hypothetical protein